MKETIYLLESLPGTFKVGRTDRGFSKRYGEYQIAGGVLAVCVVENCVRAEGDLIRAMKDAFGPPVSGAETFAGDYATAIAIFLRIASGHITSRIGLPQRPTETDYSEFLAAISRGDHISAAILLDEGVRRYITLCGKENRLFDAWIKCLNSGSQGAAQLMRINGYDFCDQRMATWGAALGSPALLQWLMNDCGFDKWVRDDHSHMYELARRGDAETVAWILRNVIRPVKSRWHSKETQIKLLYCVIDSHSIGVFRVVCSREFFRDVKDLPIRIILKAIRTDHALYSAISFALVEHSLM